MTFISNIDGDKKHRKALYRCECGSLKVAEVNNVNSGHTRSCGCIRRLETSRRSLKHGHKLSTGKRTPTYTCWVNMKQRCDKEDAAQYKDYGGRGITYDPRWKDFVAFLEDMGPRPDNSSLDRIDFNDNYYKENCRWASRQVQNENRRSVTFYELNGESLTLNGWAAKTGIGRLTLRKRILAGVPLEIALTTKGFCGYRRDQRKKF